MTIKPMIAGNVPAARRIVACVVTVVAWAAGGGDANGQREPGGHEELETDRDSFTLAPTTSGARTAILEASCSFIDDRIGPEAHSFPDVLVRRGVGEKVEFRLGFDCECGGPGPVTGSAFGGEDIETENESRMLYGTKVETSEQDGWLPRSAAVIRGTTPVSGPSSRSTRVAGEAFGWRFADNWEWTSGMRYGTGFEKQNSFSQWAASSVVKAPVGDRWNVDVEYCGIFSTGKELPLNVQYGSCGGHVLATENVEIGLRFGWGLNRTSPRSSRTWGPDGDTEYAIRADGAGRRAAWGRRDGSVAQGAGAPLT